MLRVPEHPRPLFRLVAYPRRGETFLLPSLRVPLAPKQLLSPTPIHQSRASRSLIPSWGLFLGATPTAVQALPRLRRSPAVEQAVALVSHPLVQARGPSLASLRRPEDQVVTVRWRRSHWRSANNRRTLCQMVKVTLHQPSGPDIAFMTNGSTTTWRWPRRYPRNICFRYEVLVPSSYSLHANRHPTANAVHSVHRRSQAMLGPPTLVARMLRLSHEAQGVLVPGRQHERRRR